MNPNTAPQTAPDTLPADFFSSAPQTPASAPTTTGAPASQQAQAAPDTLPADFFNQQSNSSFQTPNGTTLTPGQAVTHSSGVTGTVVGQHPDTGKAVVDWSPSSPFKVGQMVTVNGHHGFVKGNSPDGKVLVDWGISPVRHTLDNVTAVSPQDISTDPGLSDRQ